MLNSESFNTEAEESLNNLLLEDLLHLRMSEEETRQWLLRLTPERVTTPLLKQWMAIIRQTALPLPVLDFPVMDCCGTGGSGVSHFNTSTSVAFVLAAGGIPVVKFGNRAMTSQSGSFDFLESMGFVAETKLEALPEILASCHLAFLYAPQCYPCLMPFNQLRRTLGVRTLFNFIGPLLNPVQPAYRLLGVSHAGMQTLIGDYLAESDLKKAWVVHSPFKPATEPEMGLDEIVCNGFTRVLEIQPATVQPIALEFNFPVLPTSFQSHTASDNTAIFQQIVAGEDTVSIYYRMICINAGAGFYVANQTASLEEGIRFAEELLAQGKVQETLKQCRRVHDNFSR